MISIIIPTLNEEKILEKTLASLAQYSAKNKNLLEIIISDGKSTDSTISIAHKYANTVAVHDGLTRQTIAAGRNAGAKQAKGDILLFLDADCTIKHPDFFFKTVLDQFKDPTLVALTGWLKVLPEHATLADRFISYIISFVYMVLNNNFSVGSSFGELQIIRKSSFEKLCGYNEKLVTGEDVDMFNRLSKIGRTRLEPSLLIYHTGRRAHKIGWPRLLFQWFINTVWMTFRGKSPSKEWTVIR